MDVLIAVAPPHGETQEIASIGAEADEDEEPR
jgi:hypothetical protein